MDVFGYPLWWAGIDGLDVVLGGAIVFVLLGELRGLRQAWLVLVPAVALGAAAGIVGWPISTALNSGWSTRAKYGCALASIGLSVACVTLLARALPKLAGRPRDAERASDPQNFATTPTTNSTPTEDHNAPSPTDTPVGAFRG
jgi:hypothetical protein